MSQRDNHTHRCEHRNCRRATFVETGDGISSDFRHGSETHREVYTVEQMIVYLRVKGYVVIEAEKLLRVA